MVPSRVGCGGFQLECSMVDHAFVLSSLRATLRRTLVSVRDAQWLIFSVEARCWRRSRERLRTTANDCDTTRS